MKRVVLLTCFLAGCLGTDGPVETGEVESWIAPLAPQGTPGQGSNMQGSNMQGSNMQGSNMQGSNMQGSTFDGGTHGGVVFVDARIDGTALSFWKKVKTLKTYYWEYRSPVSLCKYNATRTQLLEPCTKYFPGNSPLLGSTWPTTFTRKNPDGTTTTIPVTLRIEAVRTDPSKAMHPVKGSAFATNDATTIVPCDNPRGCRNNSDIWNYDVRAIDVVDASGQNPWLCPATQTAIALPGRWASDGTYENVKAFTFACTNGVIAKCTRWGYRPYDRATRANDIFQFPIALAGYHQTCVRAAMADYCGIAHSFTKDGTHVDVFDYETSSEMGFIPPTTSAPGGDPITAFAYEGWFDQRGATMIESGRYQELAGSPEWAIGSVCPGRFGPSEFEDYVRFGDRVGPFIGVKSAPMCAHSELKIGKWLHRDCSPCAASVPAYCTDASDARGWDAGCVTAVMASATCANPTSRMAAHSECTAGASLERFDTGCTLAVCDPYDDEVDHCCADGGTWDAACIARAEQVCTGGGEHRPAWGYCTPSALPPNPLPPLGFN